MKEQKTADFGTDTSFTFQCTNECKLPPRDLGREIGFQAPFKGLLSYNLLALKQKVRSAV